MYEYILTYIFTFTYFILSTIPVSIPSKLSLISDKMCIRDSYYIDIEVKQTTNFLDDI